MTQGPGLIRAEDLVVVVIDVQVRLSAAMERRDDVVRTTGKLVRVAELLHAPVIATRQYPRGLGELEPDLDEALERAGARVVDKMAFCCGREPDFVTTLERTGRRQVVVAGMETHICVCQTVIDLLDRGFDVHVAADACCSRRAADHDIALDRMRAVGATVSVFESIAYEAVGVAGTDQFRALLGIVKD